MRTPSRVCRSRGLCSRCRSRSAFLCLPVWRQRLRCPTRRSGQMRGVSSAVGGAVGAPLPHQPHSALPLANCLAAPGVLPLRLSPVVPAQSSSAWLRRAVPLAAVARWQGRDGYGAADGAVPAPRSARPHQPRCPFPTCLAGPGVLPLRPTCTAGCRWRPPPARRSLRTGRSVHTAACWGWPVQCHVRRPPHLRTWSVTTCALRAGCLELLSWSSWALA